MALADSHSDIVNHIGGDRVGRNHNKQQKMDTVLIMVVGWL